MSVTFTAYDSNAQELVPSGFTFTYEDDPMYGRIQTNQNPWSLNVSNSNFRSLSDLLGFELDWCGAWNDGSLQHVRDSIVFVLESVTAIPALDGGRPSEQTGNFIDCGLREGYYTDRLSTLLTIVDQALAQNGSVVWS